MQGLDPCFTRDGLHICAPLSKVPGEGVELVTDDAGLDLLPYYPLGQDILPTEEAVAARDVTSLF